MSRKTLADLAKSDLVTAYEGSRSCVEDIGVWSYQGCQRQARWNVTGYTHRRPGPVCTQHACKRLVVAERLAVKP